MQPPVTVSHAAAVASVGLAAGTAAYLFVIAGTLRAPLNPGADRRWLAVTVVVAAAATLATWRGRPRVPWVVGTVAALGLAMIGLSGNVRAALVAAWVLALATAWGGEALARVGGRGDLARAERVAIALSLGLALLALVGLLLGLARVLRPWPIFLTLLGLTVAWPPVWRRAWRDLGRDADEPAPPEVVGLAVALGFAFVLALTWAVAPEVQYDALNYQLTVPRIYLAEGGPVDLPHFFHSYFAHLVNMLYALLLALGGQGAAKLLTLATGVVAAAGTYELGRRAFGRRVGLWAMALFGSTPLVIWQAGTTYIDLPATLFVLAGVLALLRWRESPTAGWALVTGALVGAAVGSKLTAGLVVPAVAAVMLATLARRPDTSVRSLVTAVGSATAGASLVATPWYALIYAYTGNPVYPLLNGLFKSRDWPIGNTRFSFEAWGVGTSPGSFLRLPWALTFDTLKFGESMLPGAMGLALALLPLAVLLLAARGRHRRTLVAATVLSVLVWGWQFQYARFLLPVLPLVVVVAAAAVLHGARPAWLLGLDVALLGLVVAAQLAGTAPLFSNIPERFPLRRAMGLETAEAFTTRALPDYVAAQYLNRVSAPGERVVGLTAAHLRFYVNPPLLSLESLHVLREQGTQAPRGLARTLLARGYVYLMLGSQRVPWDPFSRQEFLDCCTVQEFAGNGTVVYRIVAAPVAPGAGPPNLLANPSFEILTPRGDPESWGVHGRPVVGGPAHSGKVAVAVGPQDNLVQVVPVDAGVLYELSHLTRADAPQQQARLQINWLDANRQIVEVSLQVVPAGSQWTKHVLRATAPAAAQWAAVYAAVHGESRVWFDDFALSRQP